MVTNIFYDALLAEGWPLGERPRAEPTQPSPGAGAQLLWMATKGTQWIVRRSTDLLPQLMRLAVSEWRHARLGLSSQLDLQMAAEALAAVYAGDHDMDAGRGPSSLG